MWQLRCNHLRFYHALDELFRLILSATMLSLNAIVWKSMDKPPRIVFSTPWFEIEEIDPPHVGSDANQPYYRMNTEDGVMIVPLTEDGEIVCVRQFRPAIGRWTLELPSGGVDKGEEPIDLSRKPVSFHLGSTIYRRAS